MPLDCGEFPYAEVEGYSEESSATPFYNCIAWAAGDNKRGWWPNSYGYWPPSAPREETIDAFVKAYESLGYKSCADSMLETGNEKVAIYALDNSPTHAALQLENGKWTSKIGQNIDIEHATLRAVEGPIYGWPVRYLKRRR